MAFTRNTEAVNNISLQPDQPVISATALKALFDKSGADEQDYNNDVLLVELEAPTAASSLGQNNGSYGATIQSAIDTITSAGSGTIPPDGTITNLKLATDVKVGSLASSTTTDKSSVIAVTNEILTTVSSNEAKRRKFVSLSDLNKTDATLTDVPNCSVSVEAGKTYRIETFAKYQTTINTTGIKFYSYLPSGAGTIFGEDKVHLDVVITSTNVSMISVSAIGASGLAGSGLTTTGIGPINTDLQIYSNVLFKCTSTGEFRHQFASEVAAASVLKAGVTVLVTEV